MRPQKIWPGAMATMPDPACPPTHGAFTDCPQISLSSPAPGGQVGTQSLEHATAATLTQNRSHDWEQHEGSTAHTALQHAASLHAGVGCGCVHDPAPGSPHVPLPPPHRLVAPSTHVVSHVSWQQYGSAPHTSAQHVALLHAGVLCGAKQLPALPEPHSWQSRLTASTQGASQLTVQQVGSMLHTVEQQTRSEHPGVGCALRHEPMAPGGHWAPAEGCPASAASKSPYRACNRIAARICDSIPHARALSKRGMKKAPGGCRGP
jgi:hypothetical protein